MALEKLSLESLARIDSNRIGIAFANALRRCEDDCRERPNNAKARKVSIEVELCPIVEEGANELDRVEVSFKIKDSLPTRSSKSFAMEATEDGLVFNESSPDNPRQRTLDDAPTATDSPRTGPRAMAAGE